MGAMATVIDVTKNVERINSQPLYDVTQGYNEVVGTSRGDDGIDDNIYIGAFVIVIRPFVEQLLDNITEIFRQILAYLRACVFARNILADVYKLMDCNVIPVVDVASGTLYQLKLLFF